MPRRKHNRPNKPIHERQNWEPAKYDESGKRIDDRPPGHMRKGWDPIERVNQQMFEYYKGIEVIPAEEWDAFVSALQNPLPTTFRVTGIRSQAEELVKMMKTKYFRHLSDATVDGEKVEPPREIAWYPGALAWQVNLSRSAIRKLPELHSFHKFLIAETESGNISRQEAVSMIPPLLLDVESHHKILDMCAAPGSKTAQIIELLHSADESRVTPDGFVIANDVDNKRCYLMVHQIKRIESPCFMVVNHDAAKFPRIKANAAGDCVRYDRVLADVPCSGDGTIRKNIDIWKKWHPLMACNLHRTQRAILEKGIELLENGGRIVYSTCSMNPIEDEAVIASVLLEHPEMTLVDVGERLPALKTAPGLKTWKLRDRAGTWMSTIDDVPANLKTVCFKTMFPPSTDDAENLRLERCLRILPHHQNTGGFFIAVLHKESIARMDIVDSPKVDECIASGSNKASDAPIEETPEDAPTDGVSEDKLESDPPTNDEGVARAKRERSRSPENIFKNKRMKGYSEDKVFYVEDGDEELWPEIRAFFDINADFPYTQLLYRGESGRKRNLYFTSEPIKQIASSNGRRLRAVNLGLRMFTRNENVHVKCAYRIAQEGVHQLKSYFDRRVVKIPFVDMVQLLGIEENPLLTTLTEETREKLAGITPGCVLFEYEQSGDSDDEPRCQIDLCGWLGTKSARTFIGKHERHHFLRLCGQNVETLIEEAALKEERKKEANGSAADKNNSSSEQEVKMEDVKSNVEDTSSIKDNSDV
ncbi:RNA cytosine-C(5)-methyltransferase NSUN2-like isoform X2 [Tubulanus polymorphus]